MTEDQKGWTAALLSPIFLGLAPIFGKMALIGGADPFTVAALRTGLVALMMWTFYGLFWRKFIYIYPAGLIACVAVGVTNGIGSLFYYSGLDRLDATVAQILNANYLIFVLLLTHIGGSQIGWKSILRVMVALIGTAMVTGGVSGGASWMGVALMTGNALLFAGTIVMSQRVLYEMPAQTATLYIMTAMAAVVVLARLIYDIGWTPISMDATAGIIALAVTTLLSRLLLFAGVKAIGGLRTVLLAILEGGVAVSLAFVLFDDRLTSLQWVGLITLVISMFIPTEDIKTRTGVHLGLPMPNIAGLRFQQIAFTKAFVDKDEPKDKYSTQEIRSIGKVFGGDEKLATDELEALRKMLGDDTFKRLS